MNDSLGRTKAFENSRVRYTPYEASSLANQNGRIWGVLTLSWRNATQLSYNYFHSYPETTKIKLISPFE